MKLEKFGGYRIGSNIPIRKGSVWENVARVARWGAPVIELNTNAERLGKQALSAIKQLAQANDLVYTWHVPPSEQESGELAMPNDPNRNEFARKIMERAIKSADEVGAKHITFHATNQAGKPAKDTLYVYNEQEKEVKLARQVEGLNRQETVELLDESAKARVRTQWNSLESQNQVVNQIKRTAETVTKQGVDNTNALMLSSLVDTISAQAGMLGLQPTDFHVWRRIQNKATNKQPLTSAEKKVVKNYSQKVLTQVGDYQQHFKAQMKQMKPFKKIVDKGGSLVMDGEEVMRQNVAENIAMLDKKVLKRAVKNGISLGFENMPGNILFSTPEELSDLRERTVNELVKRKKLSKAEAEQLIGFTYDIGHANTVKYFDVSGKKFASHEEFLDRLKGPVKHVHATDTIGAVDSHLPLGQGELTKEQFDKLQEALRRSGFKGTAIHELGASELPVLYGSSMEWFEGGYMVHGTPTSQMWGPSYLASSMTDPLMMEKDKGYFYESFVDIY